MREIILNPINIAPFLLISATYFLLSYQYSARRKNALILGSAFTFFLFLMMPYVRLPGFVLLHPAVLVTHGSVIWKSIVQIWVYSLIFCTLRLWFHNFSKHLIFCFKQPFLGPLIFVVVLSSSWSGTPLLTFMASLVFVGVTVLATHVASVYKWQEIFSFLRWSSTVIAVISVLVVLLIPSVGLHEKGWRGVLEHPNRLGALMALNAVLWVAYALRSPKDRLLSIGVISLSLIIIKFTNSAGSICVLLSLLGLLVVLSLVRGLSPRWAFVAITFAVMAGVILTLLVMLNMDAILAALGKGNDFSGRGPLWAVLWKYIEKRPLFGYGFEGFWQPWRKMNDPAYLVSGAFAWTPRHAHNGFIDMGLQLGLLGSSCFLLSLFRNILSAIAQAIKGKTVEDGLPLIVLVFIIISNLSVSELISLKHIWFYYVIVTIGLALASKSRSATRAY